MSEELAHYYLQTMGIQRWLMRPRNSSYENSLSLLALKVSSCVRCQLHKTRTQTVFSRGNENAKLMIIGEAPGFYEDQQGRPFVGKAGSLLNQMLRSIGLTEEDIYIANVLKCRPPNNRDPLLAEINECSEYLIQQIKLVEPHLIVALGRFAGQFLLQKQLPLNQLRKGKHNYQGVPFIVSYHPAYLLRNPADKKKAYEDLVVVKHILMENDKKTSRTNPT